MVACHSKPSGLLPFLRGAQVQVHILSFACLFQLEGMFSTSEDVKDSLRFGEEALVCPKHSRLGNLQPAERGYLISVLYNRLALFDC